MSNNISLEENKLSEIKRFTDSLPFTPSSDSYLCITIPAVSDEVWVIDTISLGEGEFAYRFNDNTTVQPWTVGHVKDVIRLYEHYVEQYRRYLLLKPEPDVDYSEPEIQ